MLVFQQISGFAGKNEKKEKGGRKMRRKRKERRKRKTEKGGLRSIFSWVTGKFLEKLVYS